MFIILFFILLNYLHFTKSFGLFVNTNTLVLYTKVLNPNKLIISGDITKNQIDNIIQLINQFISTSIDKNIFLIIDSNGGDLLEGLRLIDWIEETKQTHKINYQCVCAKAISTGFNIFELCDYRYALETCELKTHEPKISIEGTLEFANNYFSNNFTIHLEKYNQMLNKITKKIKMNQYDYENKIRGKDWIINNPNQIMQYNLADQIIYID